MNKIDSQCVCSNCKSKNILVETYLKPKLTEHINRSNFDYYVVTNDTYRRETCLECGTSIENYIDTEVTRYYQNEYLIHSNNDIEIVAEYKSINHLFKNYILYINHSYDEMADKSFDSYCIKIEGDDYPIILTKRTFDKCLNATEKAKALVYSTWKSRNK